MIDFNNTYSKLPDNFYQRTFAKKFPAPKLIAFNKDLADQLQLNLDSLSDKDIAEIFSGQLTPEGADPIALAYAGHQFGNFVPQLGDGRALLLGEVLDKDAKRFDIQLKGSGQTKFSRNGDGLSSLGPVVREYIVSEAMHFLGVPTTRALAAVETGETVYREDALPGGVFTRVATGHIRIGTFQYFAGQGDFDSVRMLADYAINRHYPHLVSEVSEKNIYLRFLLAVADKQSSLIAKWMRLGFIHGVMNTDNMSISGETIDFGPCAFMDNFSFEKVFSSIDRGGRYAYSNQTTIGVWNLYRLAECLIPLINENPQEAIKVLEEELKDIHSLYERKSINELVTKIGIFSPDDFEADEKLVINFLEYLQENDLDFTNCFRKLSKYIETDVADLVPSEKLEMFLTNWRERLKKQGKSTQEVRALMEENNPVFIPRNHQVEKAIEDAIQGNYDHFHTLNACLKIPYEEQESYSELKSEPMPDERVTATFCGT